MNSARKREAAYCAARDTPDQIRATNSARDTDMADLTTKARKALPASDFGGPDRSYPMPDRAHAASAEGASRLQFASPSVRMVRSIRANKILGQRHAEAQQMTDNLPAESREPPAGRHCPCGEQRRVSPVREIRGWATGHVGAPPRWRCSISTRIERRIAERTVVTQPASVSWNLRSRD